MSSDPSPLIVEVRRMRDYMRWRGRLDVIGVLILVALIRVAMKIWVGWRGHATDADAVEFGVWFVMAITATLAYLVCWLCARRHRPSSAPPNP